MRKIIERSRLHIPIVIYILRYNIDTLITVCRVLPITSFPFARYVREYFSRRASELRNAFKQIERKVSFPHRWLSSLGARQISAAGKRPDRV